jgi:hypothetical protein
MKDSFHDELKIVQVTAKEASKGHALLALRQKFPHIPAIAAGDDMNDIALIKEADVGIAMASAPDALKKLSKIVTPSVGEDPIIGALRQAMHMVEQGNLC